MSVYEGFVDDNGLECIFVFVGVVENVVVV